MASATKSERTIYGVIGVGAIAAAIVTGLMRNGVGQPIRLSPRGAAVAADLAGRFRDAVICPDNQVVVDESDVVLACVLPQDAEEVLRSLHFRTNQTVISAIAGLRLADLRRLVAPAIACTSEPLRRSRVDRPARVVPLPGPARPAAKQTQARGSAMKTR